MTLNHLARQNLSKSNSLQDCVLATVIWVNTNSNSFQDTLNPISSCGFDVESTSHYVLHCPTYNDKRHTLQSTIKNIDCRLSDVTEIVLIKTFLFGNCSIDAHAYAQILNASIEYILTTQRFHESLFSS